MLEQAGILSRINSDDTGTPLVLPVRDSSNITVRKVLDAVDNARARRRFPETHPKLAAMSTCLRRLRKIQGSPAEGLLLRDVDPQKCAGKNGDDTNK